MKTLFQASASATHPHPTLAVAPVTAVIKAASRRGPAIRSGASQRGIRDASTMATPYKIQVGPQETGLLKYKQTDEGAAKLSELLQEDLERHHVFFNQSGFHNHITHHLLSLFGTGASPADVASGYAENAGYQRAALAPTHRANQATVVSQLSTGPWADAAPRFLGKEQYYPDFLAFFQGECARLDGGWRALLGAYVFAGCGGGGGGGEGGGLELQQAGMDGSAATPEEGEKARRAADDLLARLYAGFLHPAIQLMFGVEWGQPAVVCMALAQACVHRADPYKEALLAAERLAGTGPNGGGGSASVEPMPSIVSLYEAARDDAVLATSARAADDNKVRDGVLARARDRALALMGRVRVRPDELDERTAEMFDAAVYAATGAAVRADDKVWKYDFFLMHHVNCAPSFVALNREEGGDGGWITQEAKVRLLEWKIRMDLVQYAARGCPSLAGFERVREYVPLEATRGLGRQELLRRLHALPDDGHAIKLARAVEVCRAVTEPYRDRDWLKVRGDDVYDKVLHVVLDSVESAGPKWVRSAGFKEAWKDVPVRKDLASL